MKLNYSYDLETAVLLGESLITRARIIYERAMIDCQKLDQMLSTFFSKNEVASKEIYHSKENVPFSMGYYSRTYTGYYPAPEEVKLYWLQYILNNLTMFTDKKNTEKQSIIKIATTFKILQEYNQRDFSGQKFNLTYPFRDSESVIIRIPHSLNKLEIDLAIKIFEEFTSSTVYAISLLYSKYEFDVGEMNYQIQVQLDYSDDLGPLVKRMDYDAFPFSDNNKWWFELPQFRKIVS